MIQGFLRKLGFGMLVIAVPTAMLTLVAYAVGSAFGLRFRGAVLIGGLGVAFWLPASMNARIALTAPAREGRASRLLALVRAFTLVFASLCVAVRALDQTFPRAHALTALVLSLCLVFATVFAEEALRRQAE